MSSSKKNFFSDPMIGLLAVPVFLFLINCSDIREIGNNSNCTAAECHASTRLGKAIPLSGKHTPHLKRGYQCENCHYNYLENINHKNGTLDANTGAVIVFFNPAGSGASWDPGDRSCSGIDCHYSKSVIGKSTESVSKVNARADGKIYWYSDISGCLTCHGSGSPLDPTVTNGSGSQGKHIAHVTEGGVDCSICHSNYAFEHGMSPMVSFNGSYLGAPVSATFDMYSKICGTISCHGGTGGIDWYAATTGCTACHASGSSIDPVTTNGSGANGKHVPHVTNKNLDCEACHKDYKTKPTHMNGTYGKAETDIIVFFNSQNPSASWNDGSRTCNNMTCHGTTDWYSTATGCTACHSSGGPIDPVTTNGSGTNGKHVAHVTNRGIDCEVCHKDYKTKPTHLNGTYGKAEADIIVFFNSQNPAASWDDGITTCNSMSCHGSVSWYADGSGCNVCHDVLNPSNGKSGSHPSHFGAGLIDTSGVNPDFKYGDTRIYKNYNQSVNAYLFGCGNCHPLDPSKHMDGQVQVELYDPAAQSSTLKGKNISTASYDNNGKTCANIYCHSSGQAESVRSYKPTPAWGTSYANTLADPKCNKCHDNPPRYESGGEGSDTANTHLVMGDDGWELGHFGGLLGPWHTSFHGSWSGFDWYAMVNPHIAAAITCQTCHFDSVDSTNTGPSGYYYLDTTGNYILPGGLLGYTCGDTGCHDGGLKDAIAPRNIGKAHPLKHVNGEKDVNFDPRTGHSPLPSAYPGYDTITINGPLWVNAIPTTIPPDSMSNGGIWSMNLTNSTYESATKTCKNIPCHINESYDKPYKYPTPPVWPPLRWGRTPVGNATCNNCHWY